MTDMAFSHYEVVMSKFSSGTKVPSFSNIRQRQGILLVISGKQFIHNFH